MDYTLSRLYIGHTFAYKGVSARVGNLKQRRKSMAAKKKETKKLRKAKKIQPTKTLFTPTYK